MPEHDPWGGTAGLIDDVDVTIVSAEFTYDPEYNDGNTLICRIEAAVDGGDADEPEVFKLSTGSGWEDADKGASARREDGKDPKGFNRSCAYQVFLAAALETDAAPIMQARGLPWDAGIWTDLRFHVQRQDYWPFTIPVADRNAENANSRLIPDAFLGEAEAKGAAKKAPAKASAKGGPKQADPEPAESAEDAPAAASSNGALPVKVRMALKRIAKETDSHDDFVERVFAEIDNAEDEPVYSAAMDDSDEGLYATASAE